MRYKCPKCCADFELVAKGLPECPECIRRRFVHMNGISAKHIEPGARSAGAGTSYIAHGADAKAIFDYMAYGEYVLESGCEVVYSNRHQSFNALSYKPLGDIPGSGVDLAGDKAKEFAVLVDLQGKSTQGPHWMFVTQGDIDRYRANGEWVQPPMCRGCGSAPVYAQGDRCLSCFEATKDGKGPSPAESGDK